MSALARGYWRDVARYLLGTLMAALVADEAAAQTGPVIAAAPQRVALVIGNSRYRVEPLPSAARDAAAVGERLKAMGFSVRSFSDLTKEQMQAAYREHVQDLIASGGVGVVYFAGHGLQFDGQTFLVPVDADTGDRREANFWAVALDPMLQILERIGNHGNVVLLDACRNNPFGRSEGRAFGLAVPTISNLKSTLVQYATAPGMKALDGGKDKHSPYAEALLANLGTSATDAAETLRRVRESVIAATRNEQAPWEVGSLRERVSLQAAATGQPSAATAPAAVPIAAGGTGAGTAILRYLGQDKGAARFAKVREVMSTDFGRQPISAGELIGILQGLASQQLVTTLHMFLNNVDGDWSVQHVKNVAAMTDAEDRLAAVSTLSRRVKGSVSVADALAILDGQTGRFRQSILFSLRDKLPPRLSGADALRLAGEADANIKATLDALMPRVESVSLAELQSLIAPLNEWQRATTLDHLMPKIDGGVSAQQALDLMGKESGAWRLQMLKALAPRLAPGLSPEQSEALLGTMESGYRLSGTKLLKPKLSAPVAAAAVAPAAAPAEPSAEAAQAARKKSKSDYRAPAAHAAEVASPQPVAAAPVAPAAPPTPATATVHPRVPAVPDPQVAPPVGDNLILSEPQVRYCMYEKERLLAVRSLLTTDDTRSRAQFDMRATDFRSRCGRYRFVRGLDTKIAAEIVEQKDSFKREALAILGRTH